MKQFFLVLFIAGGLAAVAAWQMGLLNSIAPFDRPSHDYVETPRKKLEHLGKELYPVQSLPTSALNQGVNGADPIAFPGILVTVEKMDACAQIPGQILFVGQEIPEGAAQVCGIAPLLQQKIYPARVDAGDS